MSRAVVHDPKEATSRFIRLLAHDFAHKPIDGSNSTFDFTAAEDSCSVDIPGCQVGPGTALGNNVLADFLHREPRQGEPEGVRKLAGECLNLNDETGGKSGPYARLEAAPQGHAIGQRRIAYAIY